jgi:hypothetical protein
MLYREITAVCSEIHTKHINTRCGQNVELLNVKTRYLHWLQASNGYQQCVSCSPCPSVRPCLYGFHPSFASSRLTLWSHYCHSFRTAGVSACRWIRSRADLQWASERASERAGWMWCDVMWCVEAVLTGAEWRCQQQYCGRDGHWVHSCVLTPCNLVDADVLGSLSYNDIILIIIIIITYVLWLECV